MIQSRAELGHDRIEERNERIVAQPVPHDRREAYHIAFQDISDRSFTQPSPPSAYDIAAVQVLEILRVAFGDQVIERRMNEIDPRRRQDPDVVERMLAG